MSCRILSSKNASISSCAETPRPLTALSRAAHAGPSSGRRGVNRRFSDPLAQSRDLFEAENIVVIENSGRQITSTSVEKKQVISVTIHGHDIFCR